MSIVALLQIVGGLALLVVGGEFLVRGASAIAARLGMSPLVVGLTVVSAATSAPELAVTLGAVLTDRTDMALGNVVGSNIANILLILGLSAVLAPLVVSRQVRRVDIPTLVGFSLALLAIGWDGRISVLEGVGLVAALIIYTVIVIRFSRNHPDDGEPAPEPSTLGIWAAAGLVLAGVGCLVLGSQLLVTGASRVAGALGLSELIIGLTVVAIGTSTPELASSLVAVRKGHGEMAVGNAVGSCLFNIGIVLGVPAVITGSGLAVSPAILWFDAPLMVAAALVLVPMVITGFTLARWEGIMLTALYIAYLAYLVLDAAGHDALEGYSLVMAGFVLPVIALGLIGLVVFEWGVYRGRALERSEMRAE